MPVISVIIENILLNILVRFLIDIVVIFVLVRIVYYKYNMKYEYLFSFFLIGIIIFFICSILDTVDIQLGMALGLFAVFAILRFRTINYSAKDMTYVFVIIGTSIINALANIPPPIISALVINSIIILAVYLLEIFFQNSKVDHIILIYNKPGLLAPEFKKELLKDLSRQTGFEVVKVKIKKINMTSKNAEVEIYFRQK
jgi:hypothetical protein